MASFSNVAGKQLIKFLKSIGYRFERQNKGNHRIYVHDYKKAVVVPVYKKKMVKVGLLGGVLKDIGVSKEEFLRAI